MDINAVLSVGGHMTHPETNMPPLHEELSDDEIEDLRLDAYERKEMEGKYPEGEG